MGWGWVVSAGPLRDRGQPGNDAVNKVRELAEQWEQRDTGPGKLPVLKGGGGPYQFARGPASCMGRAHSRSPGGWWKLGRSSHEHGKVIENHVHAMSLYFMYYNFCRKHETVTWARGGVHATPAMAAGVSDHVWKLEEVVALLEDREKAGGE